MSTNNPHSIDYQWIEDQDAWIKDCVSQLPKERITEKVSWWSEDNRYLTADVTPFPGPWSNDVAPYLVEIMDSLSESDPTQIVAVKKATQLCLTTAGENWLGYIIDIAPGPAMFVSADKKLAESQMELRVQRMIDQIPAIRDKIGIPALSKSTSRLTGDTQDLKRFPGGYIKAVGGRSAGKLRSFPIRYVFIDEADGMPQDVNGEGHPIDLVIKRTDSFSFNKKIFLISTPVTKGLSKTEEFFLQGDQRVYKVPCPHCGHHQELKFKNIKWEWKDRDKYKPDLKTVHYECEKCKKQLKNHDKITMLSGGFWQSTAEPEIPLMRSYHISALYSPVGFFSWEETVLSFCKALKDPTKMKTFVNTVLGETWEEKGEAPKWDKVLARVDDYDAGSIPAGGLFLTLGADIQKDRIEAELVAWGRDRVSWSIKYYILKGDTSDPYNKCYKELKKILCSTFEHELGIKLNIECAFIDSSYNAHAVYEFCRYMNEVYPIQGDDSVRKPIISKPFPVKVETPEGKKVIPNLYRYDLNVNKLKTEIYAGLQKEKPLPGEDTSWGYCHFPNNYKDEYFKQLTAEDMYRVQKGNKMIIKWGNPSQRRNEALDCRTYALGAAYYFGISEFEEEDWLELEDRVGV